MRYTVLYALHSTVCEPDLHSTIPPTTRLVGRTSSGPHRKRGPAVRLTLLERLIATIGHTNCYFNIMLSCKCMWNVVLFYTRVYCVLYVLHSTVCVTQYCMCYTVLYVLHSTVCVTQYCMRYTVLYALHSTVCVTQYCMRYTVLYALHSTVCVTQYCMRYTVLYALHSTVCVTQYCMRYTVLYALHSTVCEPDLHSTIPPTTRLAGRTVLWTSSQTRPGCSIDLALLTISYHRP